VTHVRPYYDPTTAGDYTNRVNGSEWLGWPAESLLLRNIGFERVWNADVGGVVWNLTWSFAFKKPIEVSSKIVYPGWKLVILNAGYRELVAGEPKQIYINDDPATSPVPLASDGAKLASGADPIYLPFDMRPTADFNDFDFPSDLFSAGTAPPE